MSIEDLPNELFYKIFDYLDGYDLYEGFSNLNYRFEQLLNCRLLLFKIKFHLTSYELYSSFYKQMKFINRHQIYSLNLYLPLRNNHFFSSFSIDASFNNLKFLILHEVQGDLLISVISNLSNVPRLSSLIINNFNILKYCTDIYRMVFNLPVLKYFKFSAENLDLFISLPTRTDQQYSSIKYLVIDHHCTLNEILLLTSYTPQLDHLRVYKTVKNLESFLLINLYNLNSIYLYMDDITFNHLQIFLSKIYSNLKTLLIKCSNDMKYLDIHQWERIILNYYPQLEKFYLNYYESITNDIYYEGKIDLSSSFWIQRKWIFGIEFTFGNIEYRILPISKRWYYGTENNIVIDTVKYDTLPGLTIGNVAYFVFSQIIPRKIERILTVTNIYHLEIFEKEISIPILIQILNRLSEITTLKIHSLSTDKTTKLTVKELYMLVLMKETSNITMVYLEQIDDVKCLDFIFQLCPYMKYFKVGLTHSMDIQFFFRTIFKKIKHNNNHHFDSLCIHLPTTDDKILKDIKEIIIYGSLGIHYKMKCVLDDVYLTWK